MRIVVVSAHYPPNFVSGGTLLPQQHARGLRTRGHDVSVYAGHLDESMEPLTAWDDADETGLPVRWIVTTPFTAWADPHNWDNPAVTADFSAYLGRIRPDIVHLHSLQTLGAGLVLAAPRCGARVVVTMHDFWWRCARQFLVDPAWNPCPVVVDAGACPCQVDHSWLLARNASLAPALDAIDLVLAPSRSAADVLEANGVAPGRVVVDENAVDLPHLAASDHPYRDETPPNGDGVRFTYAGGPNEMKGVHVVVDAAQRLAGVGGWSLRLFGAQPYLDGNGLDLRRLPVESLPPFPPAELDGILDTTDVLVMPSVARESYSLLTREALLRGVPVLTSDNLGPEEAVVDGENGVVVPSADAASLAEAMARLARSPDEVARLRAGARATPVATRSLDDQLDALEGHYAHLAASHHGMRDQTPPNGGMRRVLFVAGIDGAPLRYRARLPAEALALVGVDSEVRHYRDRDLPALVDAADALVVYRVPATHQVLEILDAAHRRGIPVVFDVDDLIFDPDIAAALPSIQALPDDERALYLQGVRRYRTTLEHCDGYVGSTEALVRHAHALTGLPAARFDNGVGILLAQAADAARRRPRTPGTLRIGYLSGTTTHDHDWWFVEPAVSEVLARHPDVELWLGGHLPPTPELDRLGDRLRRLPFVPWYELPGVVRDLDVNLAPLAPESTFNEAKSAIKWLEAALCETPTVASPTQPFRDAIDDGRTGLLAATTDEWLAAIDRLLTDDLLRARMGAAAQRSALLRWSPHLQAQRYVAILEEARAWRHRPRADGTRPPWRDELLDEPMLAVELEPYAYAAAPVDVGPIHPAAPTTLEKLRHALRHEGLSGTARKALGRLRKR